MPRLHPAYSPIVIGKKILRIEMGNLNRRIEEEINGVNSIMVEVIEYYSVIKTKYKLEKRDWKKFQHDIASRKVDIKHKKTLLENENHNLLDRIINEILSHEIEIKGIFEYGLGEAEKIKSSYEESRKQAIEEAKRILQGEEIEKDDRRFNKKIIPNEIKPLLINTQQYPDFFLTKWKKSGSPIDYSIAQLLIHISMKSNVPSNKELNKKFQLNKKRKRKAQNGYGWLYDCVSIYEKLLIINREVNNQIGLIYQSIYAEIINEIENSYN